MRTLISGCTGLVGSALIESLHSAGHDIRCLKRNKDASLSTFWDTRDLFSEDDDSQPFNHVIHLAGENVANGRWSTTRKKAILESRVEGTRQLVQYLATLKTPPETLLCASAVGFYGSRGDELLNEHSGLGGGFLADVCKQWEKEAKKAKEFGTRVVHLRFGMVLSPKGGALHKMLPPFKAGLGGPIGKGTGYMSWISIRDITKIVEFLINTPSVNGPVNVVSPTPVTNREFTENLAKVLHRPARLPAPPFMLRLLFGEMADEMLLSSTRAKPEKLLASGYEFKDTNLEDVLKYCTENR
ncbi:TIGR01777 family oxidoreductase [Desulfopila sp. IMCC35008]|uniref:TIGR01777 family oxidoreductase n=1 Tax=Desulfopila sp. IMCC35008 TaxID=2653858 RepID=UPI0013D245A3|nr:TIGR01777 family oxidoreductase [Desulfopila sp. IMCC35008]